MKGTMHPAWPGISFISDWNDVRFFRRRKWTMFRFLECKLDSDRVTALLSIEIVLLGVGVEIRIPLPPTAETRHMQREGTMIQQGLRESLPFEQFIEQIKQEHGVTEVRITDEALRQLKEIQEKGEKKS